MHVRTNNKSFKYNFASVNLKSVEKEKDLGVIIDKNFKFSEHGTQF